MHRTYTAHRSPTRTLLSIVAALAWAAAVSRPTPLFAGQDPAPQTAAAATAAVQAPPDDADDDSTLDPAEPEFRLVNLPTTLRLPRHKSNFTLTHRFAGNLREGSFSDQASDFFGLDEGATIGFEYRYAVMRRLQAIAYRSSFSKTVQFSGKYDAIHQHAGTPVSVSGIVAVEGTDNFHSEYAPTLGAVVSREMGEAAAFYATPTWVHHSAAVTGIDRDTFYVGVGTRLRIRPTVYVTAEVSPRVSGYAPGKPEYGFAIEKRAGGHMFQLDFTNTFGTTFGQVARGGFPDSLYLGFNLSRKFF